MVGLFRRPHFHSPGRELAMRANLAEIVVSVWPECLIGGLAISIFVIVGCRIGNRKWMRRPIDWWLRHIVSRVLEGSGWGRRAALISANNATVCGLLVLSGSAGNLAWMATAGLGLGLGGALRLLLPRINLAPPPPDSSPLRRSLYGVGLVVNMLEVPAILLSAGLSLSQSAWSEKLAGGDALQAYLLIVAPLLVVSAMGEALWISLSNPNGNLEV